MIAQIISRKSEEHQIQTLELALRGHHANSSDGKCFLLGRGELLLLLLDNK